MPPGFTPLRHEGKLTGLAAYGQPILADKIAARFSVDESGRVFSNFRDYPEMEKFIHEIVKGVSREDASASIQDALERTMLRSIARLLERTKARHLGLAGGIFANVKLNRLIAEKLPIDEIFIWGRRGHDGRRRPLLSAPARRVSELALAAPAAARRLFWPRLHEPDRQEYGGACRDPPHHRVRQWKVRRNGSMPANLAQSMSDAWSTDRAL